MIKTQLLIEGTPDEIRGVLGYIEGRPSAPDPRRAETDAGLPIEVEMVVASRGTANRDLDLVRSFLERAVNHTVTVERPEGKEEVRLFSLQVGTKQGSEDGFNDYIRLHMAGVAPAQAYVWPANGLLNLRLPASVLDRQIHAQPREAKDRDTFGVQTRLTSTAAVDEAIGLLGKLQYLRSASTERPAQEGLG